MQLEVVRVEPQSNEEKPIAHPLFVHGGGHAAWAWENFLPWFAARGYCALALSLRGYGASAGRDRLKWASLCGYVDDVAQVMRDEALEGSPLFLIGHSMGGAVVQRYLEALARKGLLPRPAGVVLLHTTTAKGWRQVIFSSETFRRHRGDVWHAIASKGSAPVDDDTREGPPGVFSQQAPWSTVVNCCNRLQAESARVMFWDLFRYASSRTDVPVLVIGSRDDRIISPGLLAAVAAAYGAPCRWLEGVGHDSMLDTGWEQVATAIEEFVARYRG